MRRLDWLLLLLVSISAVQPNLQYSRTLASSVIAAPATEHYTLNTPTILFRSISGVLGDDFASAMTSDSQGDLYVTGFIRIHCGITSACGIVSRAFLLKYNATGNLVWMRIFPDLSADSGYAATRAVAVDASGAIYVAGYSSVDQINYPNVGALLLKFDTDGNLLWERTWGNLTNIDAEGVATDASGAVYVTGTMAVAGGVFLLKFESNGTSVWQKTWGGRDDVEAQAITTDRSGDIYVVGENRSLTLSATATFLLKLDSSGNLLWEQGWGGDTINSAESLAIDPYGNILVTGLAANSNRTGGEGIPILKYNSTGTLLWQKVLRTRYPEMQGSGIAVDSSGNIYLSSPGRTFDGDEADPVFSLFGLNSDGEIRWQTVGTTSGGGSAAAILLDHSGDLIVAGCTNTLFTPSFKLTDSKADASNLTLGKPAGILQQAYFNIASPNTSGVSPSGNQNNMTQFDTYLMSVTQPLPSTPSPPVASIIQQGERNIALSWLPPETDGGSNITAYRIYRGETLGNERFLVALSNNSFVDTDLKSGETYHYSVTAVNALGESAFSNEVQATLKAAPTLSLAQILGVLTLLTAGALLLVVAALRKKKRPGLRIIIN